MIPRPAVADHANAESVRYSAYGRPFSISSADFNASGGVGTQDQFDFLAAHFAQNGQSGPSLSADHNKNGSVSIQDLFDFLADYFGEGVMAPTRELRLQCVRRHLDPYITPEPGKTSKCSGIDRKKIDDMISKCFEPDKGNPFGWPKTPSVPYPDPKEWLPKVLPLIPRVFPR